MCSKGSGDSCFIEQPTCCFSLSTEITFKSCFSHQSSFVLSQHLRKNPFNVKYKYASDYELFLKTKGQTFQLVEQFEIQN